MFSVGADAYYMEDMILVTASGHEVLTRGLPYTADEIEAVMRR
jgi:Xaa-Pro aminopeptidase